MNRLLFLIVLAFSLLLFFGCQEKWKEPEFNGEDWVPPKGTGPQNFWTINSPKVLGKHTVGTPPDSLETSDRIRYIRAVVVSSDEGGNFYKSMTIQDSTGGVSLQLDRSGLYNLYPVGQKIVLVCNGLVIGDYYHLPQIGWIYNGNQVGRINSLYFDKYLIRDGIPSPNNLPKPLTNNEIDFSSLNDVNKLVRLERVIFEQDAVGKTFSINDLTTDWKISVPLANGNKQEVIVRTSNFAKFRNMIIEGKEYNLTGILTYYRSTTKSPYQLMIRVKEDIQLYNPTPDDAYVADFTSNPVGEGKWSLYSPLGTPKWGFRDNSMQHFGNINNKVAMNDWLISPVITYPNFAKGYLRIEHQLSVLNANYNAYQIYYTTSTSTTFNPIEWHLLGELKSFPEIYEWSNPLPVSKIGAKTFRIAFRYCAPNTDVDTYNWNIRKVEIR